MPTLADLFFRAVDGVSAVDYEPDRALEPGLRAVDGILQGRARASARRLQGLHAHGPAPCKMDRASLILPGSFQRVLLRVRDAGEKNRVSRSASSSFRPGGKTLDGRPPSHPAEKPRLLESRGRGPLAAVSLAEKTNG